MFFYYNIEIVLFHGLPYSQSDHHILDLEFDFALPCRYRTARSSRETGKREATIDKRSTRVLELHVTSSYRNVWLSVAKSATSSFPELDVCSPLFSLPPAVFSNIAFKRLNHASLPSTWRASIAELFLSIAVCTTINVTLLCKCAFDYFLIQQFV